MARTKKADVTNSSANKAAYAKEYAEKGPKYARQSGSNSSKKDALNKVKMQAASQVGVTLKSGYNGDLTSQQAGSIGGQMVKTMIEAYSKNN